MSQQSLNCPITNQLMRDPVIGSDGYTYERSAIVEWLQRNPTSPITREPMSIRNLKPNRALRDVIEARMQNAISSSTSGSSTTTSAPATTTTVSSSLAISTTPQVLLNLENDKAFISVRTEDTENRLSNDIVCVVDVSGSMQAEATMKDEDGKVAEFGLSILDIVKHALKTVIGALGPQDRLALVVFDSSAEVVLNLTAMEQIAKLQCIREVERLKPKCQTNLWDGLLKGLNIIKSRSDTSRNASVLLFTDGIPNICPPRGEVAMTRRFIDENDLSSTIYTFGFGYNLDSDLLYKLALVGNGMYNFIPDSSFIGTIFVNAMGYILSTMGIDARLHVLTGNGVKILDPVFKKRSETANFNLGPFQFGQNKDLIVQFDTSSGNLNLESIRVALTYQVGTSPNEITHTGVTVDQEIPRDERDLMFARSVTIDTIETVSNLAKTQQNAKAIKVLQNNLGVIKSLNSINPNILSLIEDLEGQVNLAISNPEYFKKWGQHYLPSLMRAHDLQLCNNFKDPGVQQYMGKLFEKIRDSTDEIFNNLPPPEPSRISQMSPRARSTYVPVASMNAYNMSSNPCFAGDCTIKMADGTLKKVKELTKGDLVATPPEREATGSAKVVCILKTNCLNGQAELITFDNGLVITPWHPILVEKSPKSEWAFPGNLMKPIRTSCPAVYSLILDVGHVAYINGVQCICLGHDYQEDGIKHPYFGSQKVIEDLKKMPGWAEGLIVLNSGCLIQDQTTGLITEIVYNGN